MRRVLINHVDDQVLIETNVRVIDNAIYLWCMLNDSVVQNIKDHLFEIRPLNQS